MGSLPRRIEKLGESLDALPEAYDAMTLSELDGFIAGIIVCPEAVGEEEWLSALWQDVAEDGQTPLDMTAIESVVPDIIDHYKRVLLQLKADENGYTPIYDVANDDSLVWQLWAMGFGEAMQLRMASWDIIMAGAGQDEEVVDALAGLMAAISMAHGISAEELKGTDDSGAVDFESVAENAADFIPVWVETLFDWRIAHRPEPAQVPVRVEKIGRNDPCPCGSGKKHKKCCGAREAA